MNTITKEQLTDHREWVFSGGLRGKRLVLTRAVLTDADLTDADLTRAVLTDAVLTRAVLTDAVLTDATMPDQPSDPADPSRPPYGTPEYYADKARRYRERNPDVPVVERPDARMLSRIEAEPGCLEMGTWHGKSVCGTTHCRAGHIIDLAGPAGYALENRFGPETAGRMIYRASTGRVPHFFDTNERALEDIRARAAEQATPAADQT